MLIGRQSKTTILEILLKTNIFQIPFLSTFNSIIFFMFKRITQQIFELIGTVLKETKDSNPIFHMKCHKGVAKGKSVTTSLHFWLQTTINQGFQMRH